MSTSIVSKLSREQLDAILFPVAKPKTPIKKLTSEEFKQLLERSKARSREEARQKYLLKQSQRTSSTRSRTETIPPLLQRPDSDGLAFSFSKSNEDIHLSRNTNFLKIRKLSKGSNLSRDIPSNTNKDSAIDAGAPSSFIPVSSKIPGCSDRVFQTLFKSSSVNPHQQRFVEQSVLSEIRNLLEFIHGAELSLSQSSSSLDGMSFSVQSDVSVFSDRIYPIRATISLSWINSKNPQKLSFLTSSHADKVAQSTSSIHTARTGLRLLVNLRFWANDVPSAHLERFDFLALAQIKNFCRVMDSVSGVQFTTEILKGISPTVVSVPEHIEQSIDPLSDTNWPEEKTFRSFQVASESYYSSPDPKNAEDTSISEELDKDVSKKVSSLPLSRERSSQTYSEISIKEARSPSQNLFRWRKSVISRPLFKKVF